MDSTEYLERIQEQLRAYDFEERTADTAFNYPYYYRQTDGRARTREEWILLETIEKPSVEAVKEMIETGIDTFTAAATENGRLDRRWWYLLLVPSETNRPMNVAVKRAAGTTERGPYSGQLLPIIVDHEHGTLEYADPSGAQRLTAYGKLTKQATEYFRL